MYKLIAIDLDGTLLNSYGQISEKNRNSLQKAQQEGIEIVLASGRSTNSVKNLANDIGNNKYIICGNGSLIYNLQNVVKKPKIVDQCVLNYTLKNKVLYIDNRFNFDLNIQESLVKHNPFILSETLSQEEIKEYENIRKEAFIVHYAGPAKPWNLPYIEKADIWWSYARKPPFYEEILYKALANPYKAGAKNQIQSHLSYKLGQELMSVKTNKAKILLLPLSLIFIYG